MAIGFHLCALLLTAGFVAALRPGRRPAAAIGLALGHAFALALAAWLAHRGGFHLLRLLSFALFLYTPIAWISGALLLQPASQRLRVAAVGCATGLVAAAGWAFLWEPRWLEITHHRIGTPKLSQPVRLIVLADLQTDRIGSYEKQVLSAAARLRPDLVLLTGDYLQAPPDRWPALRAALRDALRLLGCTRLGVHAVRGDVDPEDWQTIFSGLPVSTYERTTRVELGELTLSALSPRDARSGVGLTSSAAFHVAFGHSPDFALSAPAADLLVAGHTHGGQVRLPGIGPLLTLSRVPRGWAAGRTDLGEGRILLVSRGIGMERGSAPRLRFLCRPELMVVDLVPEPGKALSAEG